MDVGQFISDAMIIIVGAFVIYVLVQAFSESVPGFGQYGWYLFGAFIVGAALYLKHALSQRQR